MIQPHLSPTDRLHCIVEPQAFHIGLLAIPSVSDARPCSESLLEAGETGSKIIQGQLHAWEVFGQLLQRLQSDGVGWNGLFKLCDALIQQRSGAAPMPTDGFVAETGQAFLLTVLPLTPLTQEQLRLLLVRPEHPDSKGSVLDTLGSDVQVGWSISLT